MSEGPQVADARPAPDPTDETRPDREAAALIRWAARWHNEHDTHLSDFPVAFLDGLAKRIESGEVTPPAPHPQGGTLRERIEALHRPWYETDGVRHDMTLPVYGDDVPAGHVCRIDGQDACRPAEEEHWVLACAECRCATDEDVAGYLFWPCPTIALLAATPAPTEAGEGR